MNQAAQPGRVETVGKPNGPHHGEEFNHLRLAPVFPADLRDKARPQ